MGRADLHIHSNYSDGSAGVEAIIRRAARLGLDAIAITDHNEIQGALAAGELCRTLGLEVKVIVGEEISTSDGHVIGLFLRQRIRPLLSAEATIEEIRRQGGLAVAAHPFSLWLKLFGCGGVGSKLEWLQFSAVETVNGSPMEGIANNFAAWFNRKFTRLAELGGSDAHTVEAVGQAYTVYPGRGLEMLRNAIYYKATKARQAKGRIGAAASFIRDHLGGKLDLYGEKGGYVRQTSPT
jgi:hypothetical protein